MPSLFYFSFYPQYLYFYLICPQFPLTLPIETVALEASPSIKYLNKNKSPLYRATMKIILFALTSPLVGKISQSFHLDPFLDFTSLFWGLHLAYFSDQISPTITQLFQASFSGGLLYLEAFRQLQVYVYLISFAQQLFLLIPSQSLKSIHAILGASLLALSILSLISAYTIYFVPVYKFISFNPVTVTLIFSHHIWVSLFFIMGAYAHFTIYIIRDI